MKQRTLLSTVKATSSIQQPQTSTEAATKYYNYIVNEIDEEREHRRLQERQDWIRQRSKNHLWFRYGYFLESPNTNYLQHYLYVGISYKFTLARVFVSHACTQITINTFRNDLVFFTVIIQC